MMGEADMKEKQFTIITISRQMGSGGTYIGYLAAKELEFKYFDREILQQAANKLGIEPGMLEPYDGRSASLMENIVQSFCFSTPEMTTLPPLRKPVYSKDLFALESKIMTEVADCCNAVIIGRGGFSILKNRSDAIHIFVHAPLDYRIERIMKKQKIADKKEVQKMIEESDHERTKFIRNMTGTDWCDARNYHLCIDSSVVGFSDCVKMITKLVNIKRVTQ
jgi:cytidylate kinase